MNKVTKIAVVVGVVNLALNMAENITHYSLGKSNGNGFKLHLPNKTETAHMLVTSILSSILVAVIVKHIAKGTPSANGMAFI